MKRLPIILFILISLDSYGQIEPRKDWPIFFQQEFDLLKEQNIDTFLVYYAYLGPWTNLPDSCKEIPFVSIFWVKDNSYYARQLFCDSVIKNNPILVSSIPIRYFINHIKDLKLKDKYFKETKVLPPIPTDNSWEYLIFMTNNEQVISNLSDYQRSNDPWRQFIWIKTTIEAIDITKNELNKIKNGR